MCLKYLYNYHSFILTDKTSNRFWKCLKNLKKIILSINKFNANLIGFNANLINVVLINYLWGISKKIPLYKPWTNKEKSSKMLYFKHSNRKLKILIHLIDTVTCVKLSFRRFHGRIFPRRTFSWKIFSRKIFSQIDIFPNGHFLES